MCVFVPPILSQALYTIYSSSNLYLCVSLVSWTRKGFYLQHSIRGFTHWDKRCYIELLTEFSGFSMVAFAHLLTCSHANVVVASLDRVATHILKTNKKDMVYIYTHTHTHIYNGILLRRKKE